MVFGSALCKMYDCIKYNYMCSGKLKHNLCTKWLHTGLIYVYIASQLFLESGFYRLSDANTKMFYLFNKCPVNDSQRISLVFCWLNTITSAWLWGVSSPIMLCAMMWYLPQAAQHYTMESLNHSVFVQSVLVELYKMIVWVLEELKWATCVIHSLMKMAAGPLLPWSTQRGGLCDYI